MKPSISAYIIRTFIPLLFICIPWLSVLAYGNKDVANLLGWIPNPNANLCQGYYGEPDILTKNPIPTPISHVPTQITYSGSGNFYNFGQSVLNKNIVMTQPGRMSQADKALVYRDSQSGQISYVRLEGHVQVRESGKLLAGPYCTIHLDNHTIETGPLAYHLFEDPKNMNFVIHPYDAWGTASKTFRNASGIMSLWNATYTTCAPTDPAWQISAGHLILNQRDGFATAYDMKLKFYNVPILYVPIYSFPIDNRRKTGFLTPDVSYESKNGLQMSLPYYWNLAPNYDLTTTPKYMENRGFQFNNLFRYLLSPGNDGKVYLSIVPNDNAFKDFQRETLSNPPPAPPDVSLKPYLNDLQADSQFRGFMHFQHNLAFDENWTGHLQANYTTDDYFFRDFGNVYNDIVANQLLNQADIEYKNNHWNFIGLLQGYQTLHRIDQAANPAINQYLRLPELDFSGNFIDFWRGNDFAISGQSVNFVYRSDFNPTTLQKPIGERLHLRPALSHPFNGDYGFITPQLALDSTSYATELAAEEGESFRKQFDASRNIPIFNIDSGLYFNQRLQINGAPFLATLEPRLFYLYIPFLNQNKYPNFDSELLPFTFSQLFDVNRFTSYDRLENANQLSFGITSRILDNNSLFQKFKFEFGFGYYFQSPKVCLDPNDCQTSYRYISPDSYLTPLITQLTYFPIQNWSATASYAWDSNLGKTNNAQIGINYNLKQMYVFNINYQFVREPNGDPVDHFNLSNDTNLISSGVAWPLSKNWNGLAYASYNISKQRPDTYYGGLQYDTCCWTFRVIASRSFSSQEANEKGEPVNIFKNSYYVQLQLKSLGNVGNSATSLLANTLSGYLDPFK